jgi:hypothetical protein
MNRNEKNKVRAAFALKKISEPVVLDSKLLRKQINTMSSLTHVVNNEIGDCLIGAEQVLEIFEWLPKGEYVITVKIV